MSLANFVSFTFLIELLLGEWPGRDLGFQLYSNEYTRDGGVRVHVHARVRVCVYAFQNSVVRRTREGLRVSLPLASQRGMRDAFLGVGALAAAALPSCVRLRLGNVIIFSRYALGEIIE